MDRGAALTGHSREYKRGLNHGRHRRRVSLEAIRVERKLLGGQYVYVSYA
jgi:hypothetical protein